MHEKLGRHVLTPRGGEAESQIITKSLTTYHRKDWNLDWKSLGVWQHLQQCKISMMPTFFLQAMTHTVRLASDYYTAAYNYYCTTQFNSNNSIKLTKLKLIKWNCKSVTLFNN